ncbi:anti-sigma factor [Candidatus Woesearchaeota archaeon]|nr:MAG: anti-sigma factor [Candidatus Woesearchaeota archaeon]
MMRFAVLGIIALIVILTVSAIPNNADIPIPAGYSGFDARERRIQTTPYSRAFQFGDLYRKDLVTFGSKGPNSRLLLTGAKSAFSGVFNLDTNAFFNQGRNPSRISNSDPRMRGFSRVDVSVPLEPLNVVLYENSVAAPRGTARLVQRGGNEWGSSNLDDFESQIFIQATDLPTIGNDEVYEAWLFDDETEYAMSLGILEFGSQKLTATLVFNIQRLITPFDAVMITREPLIDEDPTPGEIILYGQIPKGRTQLPVPTTYASRRLR